MPIDLRSDTVTKPTPAMRQAMAEAEVGDDVYGEDPTVNKLEQRAAEIFAREAAIFVPTGTMGNQIAIRLHTQHGEELICESRSHILDWEMAMAAAFSGVQARTVTGDRGILTWADIMPAIGPKLYYRAQTALVCIENTHNMAGGTVTPRANLAEICAEAKAANLKTHLDGARIFNAAAALNTSVAELTSGFDTVNFCLSKGLGAPVGSLLAGTRADIDRARSVRKALGGGMRQAGILAAAGLIALEEMPANLPQDHANTRILAEAVEKSSAATIDMASVETNIVIFTLKAAGAAPAFVATLKEQGILSSAINPHTVRFVTHYDVSRTDCEQAAVLITQTLNNLPT